MKAVLERVSIFDCDPVGLQVLAAALAPFQTRHAERVACIKRSQVIAFPFDGRTKFSMEQASVNTIRNMEASGREAIKSAAVTVGKVQAALSRWRRVHGRR
jgi:hypothetical protein